ncbi:hypothetical protein KL932_002220 [Ogataea haglerorum]|nr:hypothetical protein KL932_002220 [Ogataea haglerorum]
MPFEDLDVVSREIESLLSQDSDDSEAPADLPDMRNLSDQLPTELPSPLVTPEIGRGARLPTSVRQFSSASTSERSQALSNAKFKLPLPAIVDEKVDMARGGDEMGEISASKVLMLLKSDEKRTMISAEFGSVSIIYVRPTKSWQLVAWSSWLWHLLNTQRVPSSILGAIIFSMSICCSFLHIKGDQQKLASNWLRGLVGYGICLTRRGSPVRSWARSYF